MKDSPVEESVFFSTFPVADDIPENAEFNATWDGLLGIRGEITRVLEAARRDKVIGLSLDAEVLVQAEDETAAFLEGKWELLQEICLVSSMHQVADLDTVENVNVVDSEIINGLRIAVRPAPGEKCERCWTISTTVGQDSEHPAACKRCAQVVRTLSV